MSQKLHKTILITGGAGFIGSNFILQLLKNTNQYHIINLDKLTYAGDLKNLEEVSDLPNYTFVKGDICDRQSLLDLFKNYPIEGIIHFAAESHVDNSIAAPDNFIRTNIEGTFNLLEVARTHWAVSGTGRFLHISTDEVYGSVSDGFFTEETAYAPNSPYSASKAAADHLVRSYHKTYGLDTVITNCSNNYGPRQHFEKLIPTIIRKALANESIPIYGDGSNVRDWLFVKDHCVALQSIFEKARAGSQYVIGGGNECSNLEIARKICSILDKAHPSSGKPYGDLIKFVSDRPGHDQRYAVNAAKLEKELGWTPETSFEDGLNKTVEWYLNKYKLVN
ncbi:dTDP-glucose 4,6-dehydratase [Robiginitalea sp. IMCC44478]|uniref:dTDP-glucose 4,6-dehydratase n=1 Tax=Robiginitalea sp. IMCC44478 TaxID=3459122 RepID=UPI00404104E0